MDRQALEHGLTRRLLDHIDAGSTDFAPDILELPTDIYSEARHAEEVEVLFRGQPLVLCLSGALPGPGTYRTVDLCGTPVLLTRNDDGTVRAIANVCRHRGVRVVDGAGAGATASPARSTPGPTTSTAELVAVPDGRGVRGHVPGRQGAGASCRSPRATGWSSGRLRPGTGDRHRRLPRARAGRRAGDARLRRLGAVRRDRTSTRSRANWKVTLDTFRENYHFSFLHRKTLAKYAYGGVLTFDPFGPHLRNCSALRSIDELRDRPEERVGRRVGALQLPVRAVPEHQPDLRQPPRGAVADPAGRRDRPRSCTAPYLRPDLTDEERSKAVDMAPWICETVVDGEDFWVAGRTEPGIRTGVLDTVVFGRNEPAPQHLHQGFEDALSDARESREG